MNKYVKIGAACAAVGAAVTLGILASGTKDTEEVVPVSVTEAETQTIITTEADPMPENWEYFLEYSPFVAGMTDRAKQLLRKNPDMIGWLKIDKTQVDYPVLLDPGALEDGLPFYQEGCEYGNSYYIKRDLDRSFKESGTLFMDYRDEFGSSEADQSENIVIYGHNMLNGSMFGDLRKYRNDNSFFEKSPFIELSSNYKDYDYVIFAFFRTDGGPNAEFKYWNMQELDTEDEYNYYVDTCYKLSQYNTGVDVKYGDKLLTLQTCGDRYDTERFLIVARRLRDGEVAGDMSTIARTEEYIKAHQPEPTEESSEAQQ